MQSTDRTARSRHAADMRADRAADTLRQMDRQWSDAMAAVRASDARAEALRAAYAARRTPQPRGILVRFVSIFGGAR